jgi:hypothetical protein
LLSGSSPWVHFTGVTGYWLFWQPVCHLFSDITRLVLGGSLILDKTTAGGQTRYIGI